jgi:hypothetical protein
MVEMRVIVIWNWYWFYLVYCRVLKLWRLVEFHTNLHTDALDHGTVWLSRIRRKLLPPSSQQDFCPQDYTGMLHYHEIYRPGSSKAVVFNMEYAKTSYSVCKIEEKYYFEKTLNNQHQIKD